MKEENYDIIRQAKHEKRPGSDGVHNEMVKLQPSLMFYLLYVVCAFKGSTRSIQRNGNVEYSPRYTRRVNSMNPVTADRYIYIYIYICAAVLLGPSNIINAAISESISK